MEGNNEWRLMKPRNNRQRATCQQGDEMATRDQRDKLSAGIGADHDLSWTEAKDGRNALTDFETSIRSDEK